MPKEQAEYHLKRCIDSGLWVPNAKDAEASGNATAAGGGDGGAGAAQEEEIYEEVDQ